jgi:hypothetical protein
MSPSPPKNQDNPDHRLLMRLLYQTPRKVKLRERIVEFLSYGMWQGVGAVISLFSLIVTVILTLYIYDLTRNNESANVLLEEYFARFQVAGQVAGNYKEGDLVGYKFVISNDGPAVAEDLILVVRSNNHIECYNYFDFQIGIFDTSTIRSDYISLTANQSSDSRRCSFTIDKLHPRFKTSIWVREQIRLQYPSSGYAIPTGYPVPGNPPINSQLAPTPNTAVYPPSVSIYVTGSNVVVKKLPVDSQILYLPTSK